MKRILRLLLFLALFPAVAHAGSLQIWATQLAPVVAWNGSATTFELQVPDKNSRVFIEGGNGSGTSNGSFLQLAGSGTGFGTGAVLLSTGDISGSALTLRSTNATGTMAFQTGGSVTHLALDATGNVTQTITGGSPSSIITDGTISLRARVVNGDRAYFGTSSSTSLGLETGGTQKFNLGTTGDFQSDSTNGGNVILTVAGKNYQLKGGGVAARAGTFTCNGVSAVTITTSSAGGNMAIAFSPNTIAGTAGIAAPYVSAITPGTSFAVKCSIAGETSTYNWAMTTVN